MEKGDNRRKDGSGRSRNWSLSGRARSGLEVARREATTPRIVAAAAIGAAAAAFGLLRDSDRRQRLRQRAHDFRHGLSRRQTAPGQGQAAAAG